VRIADLLEAEGRAARRAVERLGKGLSLVVVAAALVLVGSLLVFTGVFLALGERIGQAGAAAVTGAIALAVAGGLFWWASKMMK
jgi:protein-S-isoprenylcysteine O-methyltransferase Ste14